jgi:signal transduction histidine kinase
MAMWFLRFFDSLSLRVLVLTIGFVILSEAIILIPSMARSYQVILQQRIDAAYLASLFLPDNRRITSAEAGQLLGNLDVMAMRLKNGEQIRNLGAVILPVHHTVNLSEYNLWQGARDAFYVLTSTQSWVLHLTGQPGRDQTQTIELWLENRDIALALAEFTNRNIQLSVSVAVITAILVFAALQFYMVAPLQRLSGSMTAFRHDPENPKSLIPPSKRRDEIGTALRELLLMQNGLRLALRQQARLAALGAAVTKINHDLRNILSTAQLVSDRLANIDDPNVQKLTPRLLAAIDRATALCETTLQYAKEGTPHLHRQNFPLQDLLQEITQNLQLSFADAKFDIAMPKDLSLYADREQFYRILTNLLRNAAQAGAAHITISAPPDHDSIKIRIADDGPGIKPTARERLFQPFIGSARKGGTGLGLTIARDLLRAHDGDIQLLETGDKGTIFELTIPRPETEA